MNFNRSTIFRQAWANARTIHANFRRNERLFGPAPSLRSCFSKALREAWATAKAEAAAAQATQAARTAAAALPPVERTRLAAAAQDALARLVFSDAPMAAIASRRDALNAQLAAFS
ncbi:hypothetical protein [Pannonibacter sp. SL95]|uniref:hypothetical protein n=1 Tax=Pannonibacter sp. SL95 TaxID=2995153 RepID=UPI0022728EF2|nr:hypothetical protein [Pannonibacter sp. SL95]MCY1705858.1 hypothetical protein [Pannonibacter sp. SL95]